MKKSIFFALFTPVILATCFFISGSTKAQAQAVCPAGYICTPVTTAEYNCPPSLTCTPTYSTYDIDVSTLSNLSKRDAIRQMYLALQHREPDAQGWDYWTNNTASLDSIKSQMKSGVEYRTHMKIVQIYHDVLKRDPTDLELTKWYYTAEYKNYDTSMVCPGIGGTNCSSSDSIPTLPYPVYNNNTVACDFSNSIIFSTNLTIGDNNSDVITLQTWLINKGYDIPLISSGKVAKGYFGPSTSAALGRYQASRGLPATGELDVLTRSSINNGSCTLPPAPKPKIPTCTTSQIWNGTACVTPPTAVNYPIVYSVSPASAPWGTSLILSGYHFQVGTNDVQFQTAGTNGTPVTMTLKGTSYDGKQMTVSLPASYYNITSGTFKIFVDNDQYGFSDQNPTYYANPVKFTLTSGNTAPLTISLGTDLSPANANPGVYTANLSFLGGTAAQPVTTWSLSFQCPSGVDVSTSPGASCLNPFVMGSNGQNYGNVSSKAFFFKNYNFSSQTVSMTLTAYGAGNSVLDTTHSAVLGTAHATINVPNTSSGNQTWQQVTVLSPNGGESFVAGQQMNVTWKTTTGTFQFLPTSKVTVYLDSVNPNGSSAAVAIFPNLPNTGSASVTIPSTVQPGTNYKVNVLVYAEAPAPIGSAQDDDSDNVFRINSGPTITPGGITPAGATTNTTPAPAAPSARLTIEGGSSYTYKVGDINHYYWSSANADTFSSSYTSIGPAACGSGPWVANTNTGQSSTIIGSQYAGCVWTVTYTAKNSQTGQSASATVVVTVQAAAASTNSTSASNLNNSSAAVNALQANYDAWNRKSQPKP